LSTTNLSSPPPPPPPPPRPRPPYIITITTNPPPPPPPLTTTTTTTTTTATFSNIFDLDNIYGSKIKVLLELTNRIMAANGKENPSTQSKTPIIHFVEDRYETLINVLEHDGLSHVQLYLADWGYNTEQQREAVRSKYNSRIKLISQSDFRQMVLSLV